MPRTNTLPSLLFPALALAMAFALEEARTARLLTPLPNGVVLALTVLAAGIVVGTVFAALHHAEVVGARVGEPLGTLVLTISVTIIEVAIITSTMREQDSPTIAREAVFSAIMIVCNGTLGCCMLLGGLRHHEQKVQPLGTSAYLSILIALSVLTLVLPNFTHSTHGPTLTNSQLAFVSLSSVALYGTFLFTQTIRHRANFAEVGVSLYEDEPYVPKPTSRQALFAFLLLLLSLLGVSLLAEDVAAGLRRLLRWCNVADVNPIIGAALALMLLLPESLSALRAAMRNAIQRSLNIGLGSVLATTGLTVPAIGAVSILSGKQLTLGLDPRDSTMLLLTLSLNIISFGTGRTNMLTGIVHLVVFANYVFLLVVP